MTNYYNNVLVCPDCGELYKFENNEIAEKWHNTECVNCQNAVLEYLERSIE